MGVVSLYELALQFYVHDFLMIFSADSARYLAYCLYTIPWHRTYPRRTGTHIFLGY